VCLALVVTREGIPLGYEVFPGNRVDVTTVEEIVETMEARYGLAQRIWVMDRGMTSEDNLTWLRTSGRRYLIGTPKSELRKWAGALTEGRDWTTVREGVEAKACVGPEGGETFLLVRSVERREKERAMHARFAERIEAGLMRLAGRLQRARRPVDRGRVERQIGRLLAHQARAAGRYVIDVVEAPTLASGIRLTWTTRPEWDDWARWSEGCYVLRSNILDWPPEELWRTYVQLSDAEAAFRIQKSDLALRPIWHQRADRVQAHILVCFLAYVLWKTLEQWQQRAGLGHSPRTILEELRRIQSTDVVLPTTDEREVRLRCVVRPDRAQALLLDRLGLDLPERLQPTGPFTPATGS
jgi:transposase